MANAVNTQRVVRVGFRLYRQLVRRLCGLRRGTVVGACSQPCGAARRDDLESSGDAHRSVAREATEEANITMPMYTTVFWDAREAADAARTLERPARRRARRPTVARPPARASSRHRTRCGR